MTRYSRSVIPGRPSGEPLVGEVENLVFGKKGRGRAAAANDEAGDDDFDDDDARLVERATADRRKGKVRRKSDFAPLPQEGDGYRSSEEGSRRGPILLVGALVIVGVFGVVVWNAYRDGVRSQDSAVAPVLAESGAFKSKPDEAPAPNAGAVEASVFEQVEAPRLAVDPAPEQRETLKAPSQFVTPPRSVVGPAVVAPAPVAPPPRAAVKPAAVPVATAAKPPVQTPVQTKAPEPKAAAVSPAPKPPAPKPSTPKPSTPELATPESATPRPAVAAALQTAPAPAPKQAAPKREATSLLGGPVFTPAFAGDGKYVVQVAAASSEAAANTEWDKRVRTMPELFTGAAEKIIVQADVNGRTVYRVRAGAFATPADADGFCNAIKAKGGACFRTTR